MPIYQQIQDTISRPSPITLINVFNPSSSDKNGKQVQALVDTGSGVTALPTSVINELGGLNYTTIQVRSPLDGNQIKKYKYSVRLELDGRSHEVEVIAIQKPYGIIGRDILNYYKIVLNAPLTKWGMNCSCEEGGCSLSK